MPETRYFGDIQTKFSLVNKDYVDKILQATYDLEFIKDFNGEQGIITVDYDLADSNIQFFIFTGRYGSSNNFFSSTIIPAQDFWLKKQFFITMSGVIQTSDARYCDIIYVNSTQVQVRAYNNTLTGSLYACKKKLTSNTLAYTTADILWQGQQNSGNITLNNRIGDYDYIEFLVAGGSSFSGAFPLPPYRVPVKDLINAKGNGHYIFSISWDASINRYIFINGTLNADSTTLPLSYGSQSFIYLVRGIRVTAEKDYHLYDHQICLWNNSTKTNGIICRVINNRPSAFSNRQEFAQWGIDNNTAKSIQTSLEAHYTQAINNCQIYFSNSTTCYYYDGSSWITTTWGSSVFEDNVRVI